MLRRRGRHQLDPRVRSHRGIVWYRTQFPGPHKGIRHQVDGFLGHPSSKEQLDILCLNNNNLGHGQITNSNSSGQDQIINNSIVRMATIVASLVELSITLPGLVPKISSLPKVKTRSRTTRARARSRLCKSDKGGLTSLLLQNFQRAHQL